MSETQLATALAGAAQEVEAEIDRLARFVGTQMVSWKDGARDG